MAIVAAERLDGAGVPAVHVDERAPRLHVDLQTADRALDVVSRRAERVGKLRRRERLGKTVLPPPRVIKSDEAEPWQANRKRAVWT